MDHVKTERYTLGARSVSIDFAPLYNGYANGYGGEGRYYVTVVDIRRGRFPIRLHYNIFETSLRRLRRVLPTRKEDT